MWSLERPLALLFLLLLPVGIYFRHFWSGRGGRIAFAHRNWRGRGNPPVDVGVVIVYVFSLVLFWVGIVMLVVALSGPLRIERERVYLNRGIDIMVTLDESPSMGAQDLRPGNRFEVARQTIAEFVQNRENDAVGLVTFGRQALLRVPPTVDHDFLLDQLNSLTLFSLGDGTAIGLGLALSLLHLSDLEEGERVVVLLTDGNNNAGEIAPATAVAMARELGIRVYVIGLGRSEETVLEFIDPETGELFRGTYQGGFDERLLREIAEGTGGAYFYAGTSGALQSVFQAIDTIETVERRVRVSVRTHPIYRVFVFIGLALILADYLLRRIILRESP